MKPIILSLLLFLTFPALSQTVTDPDKKLEWWGNPDGYLNQQAKVTLNLADQALRSTPPSVNDPVIRKMAYLMIDNVSHEEKAPLQPAVQDFFHHRIAEAVRQIQTEKVKKGAVIWKLYNHAFVVKTPSVTIGFDIQRGMTGSEDFMLSRQLMQELADAIDILFVSHNHDDHTDMVFAKMLLAQNKPVVTQADIWAGSPIYGKIMHPERDANQIQKIALPIKNIELQIVVYPGHQGADLQNNVYLVYSPEGITFLHTGDQSYAADFSWIDLVGDNHRVDILMINSWSVYPKHRYEKGYRPRLIIPGHENELGHTIDHREPYWLNENRLGNKTDFPWVQMVWGEKYHYLPKNFRQV